MFGGIHATVTSLCQINEVHETSAYEIWAKEPL